MSNNVAPSQRSMAFSVFTGIIAAVVFLCVAVPAVIIGGPLILGYLITKSDVQPVVHYVPPVAAPVQPTATPISVRPEITPVSAVDAFAEAERKKAEWTRIRNENVAKANAERADHPIAEDHKTPRTFTSGDGRQFTNAIPVRLQGKKLYFQTDAGVEYVESILLPADIKAEFFPQQ